MSSESLRWGLLSTARINRRLIPAIRKAERAELVAVASRDQDRAEEYAAEWEIPRAHGSYQALLADPEVDVVYISVPNSLHAEWTVRAAQAGKHVLCEKPLTTSVTDCGRVIAAAQEANVVVAEAIMYLYHPLLQKVRKLVNEGTLGRVVLVRGSFSFFLERLHDVRWNPELGGGALWDLGCYPISFVRWIAGEPGDAFGWQQTSSSGVDAAFTGLLRFKDGVQSLVDCGLRQQYRNQVEVVGTEGRLLIDNAFLIGPDTRAVLQQGSEEEVEIEVPEGSAYSYEVAALTAAILEGAELPVSLTSSRWNVATLATFYASARQGRPLPVPEV